MLKTVVFVPSAPALVPEVSGPGAVELDDVRAAAIDALRAAAVPGVRWIAIGNTAGGTEDFDPTMVGTFRGFGVDRTVVLSARNGGHQSTREANPHWPTSMLIAGWLREQAGIDDCSAQVIPTDLRGSAITDRAVELRSAIASGDRYALLVVGDGATSLSQRAPGGGDEAGAHQLQAQIDAALGSADRDALLALPRDECDQFDVGGRAVWQVVAAACAGATIDASLNYRGAPLGVGYTVAAWSLA